MNGSEAALGGPCSSPSQCLPQLRCLNYTCACPLSCVETLTGKCACVAEDGTHPVMGGGLLPAPALAYWPVVVLAAIFVFAAITTLITCVAHTIARRFAKSVARRSVPHPEISTLGDTYGTDTLYCTPSPSATPAPTPWATPVTPPRFNFFNRKGSCPNPILKYQQHVADRGHRGSVQYAPFLFQAALPVVTCALAPVKKRTSAIDSFPDDLKRLQLTHSGLSYLNRRRSTVNELSVTTGAEELRTSVVPKMFSSQTDLRTVDKDYGSNSQNFPLLSRPDYSEERARVERNVPVSLDIELITTPKLTSISSNDTFLTANTSTPQENSKYSFQSVMDSSLESYLTFSLSTPNASPPSLVGECQDTPSESPCKYPLLNNYQLPKSILKKENYALPDYLSYSPVCTTESMFPQPTANPWSTRDETPVENGSALHGSVKGNIFYKKSLVDPRNMDAADRDRLENVKKMISERIVNSLAQRSNVYAYKCSRNSNHVNSDTVSDHLNNNNVLETHL